MAASEVAVAVVRLHDLLFKSKDIITDKKLTDQIFESISNVLRILGTWGHVELNHGGNQVTQEGEEQLLLCARNAEKITEAFLVDLLRDRMSESQALVRLFTVISRSCARKKMAKDFMTKVRSLISEFAPSCPPATEGEPENERASSPSSRKKNRDKTRQRVESDIVGRHKYVEDLLGLLIDHKNDDDSNLRVISVVGEKACGKTALVRSVFSSLKVKHHFDCRAWVRVTDLGSKSDRMKHLLVDILKQTPLRDQAKDVEQKQEHQLFEMLHKSLMELRYLIVLDNFHEASLINELLVPFVDSMNGSRVIVTTPNAEMQKFADLWTPDLRLSPELTGREPEELLRVSIMGGGDTVDNDLESKMIILKERILSKCNGSPPAISLLGGLLSAVEESNWETLLDRLREHPTLDDVTRLCFDGLPYMMKPYVLYMVLFPQESEVRTRRLFRQLAAEGLSAEAAADGSVQMQLAEDSLCELERRNFIHVVQRKLDGSARSCRMPAFLHDFFCLKAKELGFLQIQHSSDSDSAKESRGMDPVAEQSTQNQRRQVQNTATGHYGHKVQCLRSFASFNTRKLGTQAREIEDLLKYPLLDGRLELLRVLDLEGVYKPVLPKTLGNKLPNLRYLGLRWTALHSIPESVGNLLLLETLDLKHTNITKVTSAVWNAKNLRHLYLSEASFSKSLKTQNTKLETLWGLYIETADSPMISVLEKLQSLKKLGVTCGPRAVKVVTQGVSKLTQLVSLRLRSRDLFGQPASLDLSDMTGLEHLSNLYLLGSMRRAQDLSVLPANLKVLTLSTLELESDPMPLLGHLSDLLVLRLLARSCTSTSLRCGQGSFQKLRVLKLWMLDKLDKFIVERGAMCNLEELEIRQCEKLGRVEGLDHVNSLKIVSLTRVEQALADELAKGGGRPQHTLVKARS